MTASEPTFSVCIPNYNYEHYLGKTIQSVLDQTYPHFEIVVADNASTDNSVEVVKSFNHDRIRLIRNRYNIGFAANLQRVSSNAENDFLILLSSDDVMRPDALQAYAEVLHAQGERADRTVIWSATDIIDEHDRVTHIIHKVPSDPMNVTTPVDRAGIGRQGTHETFRGMEILKASLLAPSRTPAPFCSTMYPRGMWEEVEGYDTAYYTLPDLAFLQKLLALDPDLVYIPRRLFGYRVHASNQISGWLATGSLKHQVDGYMRVVNYPEDVLLATGLSRRDLASRYIDQICLYEGFSDLAAGRYVRAFKGLCFGYATYPGATFINPKSHLMLALLGAGPIGIWLTQVLRLIHRRLTGR